MRGIGISVGILLASTFLNRLQLQPLTLTADTVQENSVAGTLVGYVLGSTGSLSLIDSAGSRFNLIGTMLVAGSTPTDFETAQSHSITIRETVGGLTNDTTLTINVINVAEQPALSALSLSQTVVQDASTILILGATAGSTLSGTMPAGLTLNSAARTITGTLTATSTFNLVETLADSPNSPRTNTLTLTLYSPALLFAAGEQGVWYDPSDFSTMFQDNAGTTPVTAVGQSVGLALDKSKGLVRGADVIVNGNFTTDTWWGKDSSWTISGGAAIYAGVTQNQIYTPSGILISGAWYEVTFDVTAVTTAGALPVVSQTTTNLNITATGTYTVLVLGATDGRLRFGSGTSSVWRGSIDNVVCRQILGNHATQSNLANRPILGRVPFGGRRNLLTFTEQFDNAAWAATNATKTTTIADPLGGATAVTITATASNGQILQTVAGSLGTGTNYTGSLWVRRRTGAGTVSLFNPSGGGITSITVTSEWTRYSVTSLGAANNNFIGIRLTTSGDAVDVAFGQLETGSTATPYQRVTTAFDVTQAGVPDNYYLAFDGTDDFLVTGNIDFSATDEMTVIAGVRKLSDAAAGQVLGLTGNPLGADGTFALYAPVTAANNYRYGSRGTISRTTTPTGFTAPITSVLTGQSEISADVCVLRVNGAQAGSETGDQGTGNYVNGAVFIGRQNGSSLPLNGHLFGLIVRGKTTSGTDLTNAETYMAGKSGVIF